MAKKSPKKRPIAARQSCTTHPKTTGRTSGRPAPTQRMLFGYDNVKFRVLTTWQAHDPAELAAHGIEVTREGSCKPGAQPPLYGVIRDMGLQVCGYGGHLDCYGSWPKVWQGHNATNLTPASTVALIHTLPDTLDIDRGRMLEAQILGFEFGATHVTTHALAEVYQRLGLGNNARGYGPANQVNGTRYWNKGHRKGRRESFAQHFRIYDKLAEIADARGLDALPPECHGLNLIRLEVRQHQAAARTAWKRALGRTLRLKDLFAPGTVAFMCRQFLEPYNGIERLQPSLFTPIQKPPNMTRNDRKLITLAWYVQLDGGIETYLATVACRTQRHYLRIDYEKGLALLTKLSNTSAPPTDVVADLDAAVKHGLSDFEAQAAAAHISLNEPL